MLTGSLDVELLGPHGRRTPSPWPSPWTTCTPTIGSSTSIGRHSLRWCRISSSTCAPSWPGSRPLLGILEGGLTHEVMTKIPLIGKGFNTVGTFLGDLNEHFVMPFGDFLDTLGGTFDEIEQTVAEEVFGWLGPRRRRHRHPRRSQRRRQHYGRRRARQSDQREFRGPLQACRDRRVGDRVRYGIGRAAAGGRGGACRGVGLRHRFRASASIVSVGSIS